MNLAATKATNYHGSDTYHTHINALALISCDPQSQLENCKTVIPKGALLFPVDIKWVFQFKSD